MSCTRELAILIEAEKILYKYKNLRACLEIQNTLNKITSELGHSDSKHNLDDSCSMQKEVALALSSK
jgi:hypothetical protein